jgi:cytochrome b pre-mRNA-processing protein 3
MFGWMQKRKNRRKNAACLYEAVMTQARQPYFYAMRGVPDTVDGRFELILLHAFLIWTRLKSEGQEGAMLSQALFDVMFRDMDRALRNMGVGDLGVPHHIKRMMKAFHGRAMAYAALESRREALRRNLFGTVASPKDDDILWFINYINSNIDVLSQQNPVTGMIKFKEVENDQKDICSSGFGMAA